MLVGMALMAVLVFAVMGGRATSIPFIFAAVPVCRVAPPPFGMGGAGFLVLFGSTLARFAGASWPSRRHGPGLDRLHHRQASSVEASPFRRDQSAPSRCLPSRGDGHALRWTEQ